MYIEKQTLLNRKTMTHTEFQQMDTMLNALFGAPANHRNPDENPLQPELTARQNAFIDALFDSPLFK